MRKLNKLRPAVAVFALCFALGAQALEVGGVKLEERIKQGNAELVLNGAGIRTKVFFKVYVGALYASQKSSSAAALIDGGARRMSLTLLRDLDADSLFGALKDGLAANHSEAEMTAIKPQVDQLAEIMKKIGGGKTGNVIDLDFTADGLAVAFNGEAKGKVAGAAFNKSMLKIWLGDNPVDSSLKKALLGS